MALVEGVMRRRIVRHKHEIQIWNRVTNRTSQYHSDSFKVTFVMFYSNI